MTEVKVLMPPMVWSVEVSTNFSAADAAVGRKRFTDQRGRQSGGTRDPSTTRGLRDGGTAPLTDDRNGPTPNRLYATSGYRDVPVSTSWITVDTRGGVSRLSGDFFGCHRLTTH